MVICQPLDRDLDRVVEERVRLAARGDEVHPVTEDRREVGSGNVVAETALHEIVQVAVAH